MVTPCFYTIGLPTFSLFSPTHCSTSHFISIHLPCKIENGDTSLPRRRWKKRKIPTPDLRVDTNVSAGCDRQLVSQYKSAYNSPNQGSTVHQHRQTWSKAIKFCNTTHLKYTRTTTVVEKPELSPSLVAHPSETRLASHPHHVATHDHGKGIRIKMHTTSQPPPMSQSRNTRTKHRRL